MSLFDGIRRAFRAPAERPEDVEREVDEELQFHIAMREERLRARGVPAEQASVEARRRFGDVAAIRDECVNEGEEQLRAAQIGERLDDLARDVRIAIRSMRRSPGFAVAAAALLALGIGGTTAVFSVVNAIYFRPLPYPNADRLAFASAAFADPMCDRRCARTPTAAEVAEWRNHARSIEEIGTIEPRQGIVTLSSGSLVLEGAAVSREIPDLLGLHAALGRGLVADDFFDGAPGVLVLSHSAWQSQFGGDSAVVGQVATIEDASYRIVGVLASESELGPPLFSLNVHTAEYVMPQSGVATSGSTNQAIVRVRPGVSGTAVQAELASLLRHASGADWQATVQPLRDMLADRYRGSFSLLLAAAAVVLLITCMNVGGLLIARLNDRMPELATRAVLGAGRMQLMQQVVTETALIALAGGAGGLLIGYYGTSAARIIPADRLPFWTPIVMDVRVVALAFALALLGGIALSVAPLITLSPARIVAGLRELVTAAPSRARARGIVVSAEVALSVVLFGVAGILVKQLIAAERRDLGLAKHSVVHVELDHHGPDPDATWAARVITGLRSLPGVRYVTVSGMPKRSIRRSVVRQDTVMRRPGAVRRAAVFVEGRSDPVTDVTFPIARVVTPDYFSTNGIPLVGGRAFTDADNAGAPAVAIINAASARRLFPGTSAVGHRIKIEAGGSTSDWIAIVGVSADQLWDPFATKQPDRAEILRPWNQVEALPGAVSLRIDGDSRPILSLVHGAMHSIDPSAPIAKVVPIEEWIDARMWTARFTTDVLATFAVFAIVLVCLGVYATVSYVVGRRRRELAIRMAVGATRRDVVVSVVRSATRMMTVGLAVGVVASLLISRLLRVMLYGSDGLDTTVLAAAVIGIFAAGCIAAYVPARRAARADPLASLRAD